MEEKDISHRNPHAREMNSGIIPTTFPSLSSFSNISALTGFSVAFWLIHQLLGFTLQLCMLVDAQP